MATKRKKTTPWWVSILTAIAVYCGLKYMLPAIDPESESLRSFFLLGPTIAPVATIPFLLLAAKQLYDVAPKEQGNGDATEPVESPGDDKGIR